MKKMAGVFQGHFELIMKRKQMDEDYVESLEDEQNKKIIHILGVSYLLDSLNYFIEKSAF